MPVESTRFAATLVETMVIERRRPRNGRFFDNSKKKIVSNRLTHLNDIVDPWILPIPQNDAIRRLLKKQFNFDFEH
jgi:hypothetical protein